MYALVKQLDDQKALFTTINHLFNDDVQDLRRNLVNQSESLIFQSNILIGKKSREILWRKGFYDFISLAKRFGATYKKLEGSEDDTASNAITDNNTQQSNELISLIFEGIAKYKSIVVRMEHVYQLDLRNIVDFSLLDPEPMSLSLNHKNGIQHELPNDTNINFSLEMINYALETVHAALLSIGDLHRYFIDFNFDKPHVIEREYAAKFYFEAFKLNPKIGMAQNQLGTLYAGQNYDLDSTYHYLYSLVCRIPFELSENNVVKIFVTNSEYLELVKEDRMGVSVCDFLARFKLIVDIFFYDKEVTDFNALCHCMLIDLRTLLTNKRNQLSNDLLFKMIAILFFCMSKLTTKDSPKVYSLNAFLVAICSELVDSCITNLDKFIIARSKQNEAFQDSYSVYFDLFDRDVRRSRETHKLMNNDALVKPVVVVQKSPIHVERSEPVVNSSQRSDGSNDCSKLIATNQSQTSVKSAKKRKTDENLASCSSSMSSSGVVKTENKELEYGSDVKTAKKQQIDKRKLTKFRRRRKKMHSGDTDDDSDQLSYSESEESDYEMDSDFSSEESSFRNSSSSDGDYEDDDDDDDDDNPDKTVDLKSSKEVKVKIFNFCIYLHNFSFVFYCLLFVSYLFSFFFIFSARFF